MRRGIGESVLLRCVWRPLGDLGMELGMGSVVGVDRWMGDWGGCSMCVYMTDGMEVRW